ncbi:MAG: flagellar hook-associated protein FlgK [Roseitalea sp.]|nr:flagellar hook-associated protein FlgK [Roseitalea sp.]MBO6951100.1 flagellar hook-associated protein FlgK [Rhizobiaceae bacterium]MBO6590913.1 flagellar hook-associated protein FlgK [Roseitalea sp.]MBO6599829.1 flagellar hook-associated protein FlgK [Roseitalea sp.]MBO6611585.1 flagellar hook-associated protein FlgK [Roseitalea sp.]
MTLTAAIKIAQSSLFNVSQQTQLASRNITDAGNEDYVRRQAHVSTAPYGARTYSIGRAEQPALFKSSLAALSDSAGQAVIGDAASRLQTAVNGVDNQNSASVKIGALRDALQIYSADASNPILGSSAIDAARDLARSISSASQDIQSYRAEIDRDIAAGVDDLRSLLDQFETANSLVVQGTQLRTDVNDALDQRDALLKQMSEYVSISVVQRDNNDFVLYAGQGITLFETVPRNISFDPQTAYSPTTTGNPLRIDGVPLTVGQGANTSASGKLSALMQARDSVAVQQQSQLDEIARGLVETFAETDQTGGGAPAQAGLFTYAGGPGIPPAGTLVPGMAASLTVSAAFDPEQGGDPTLLRDGGANGAAYVANTTGGAAYSDNLLALVQGLDTPRAIDAAAGIAGDRSVSGYADASIGWVENLRSTANMASQSKKALHDKLSGDYLAKTGVSIDEEMTKLIALEQSYEASARIMSVVDRLFDTLFAAVR